MSLSSKYKIISIFLLLCLVTSCAKHALYQRSDEIYNSNMAVKDAISSKIEVIKDNNLGNYNDLGISSDNVNNFLDLNSRFPIYMITGRINSFSSLYGQIFCDGLNSDFLNNKYLCMIQPQQNILQSDKFLRRDDLRVVSDYVADFLITRTDYLLAKQKSNTGPLKDFPTLDAVMFLNGSYLFLWGDNKLQSIEFSRFVTQYSEKYPGTKVTIALANNLAKILITKVILSNRWAMNFEFVNLNEVNGSNKVSNYNIIAYAGPTIDSKLSDYIEAYHKGFVPLSLSENVILNTQKAYPEISNVNAANYYSNNDLLNIVKLINNLPDSNQQDDSGKNSDLDDQHEHDTSVQAVNLPFISGARTNSNYDKYLFGKSKFNFNVKPIDEILDVDKVSNISNMNVPSIGIRNVLVATRATDPMIVYNLLSSILFKHDLVKINFATPDMREYNLNNLITGNLSDNKVIYHYGVINFKNFATNSSNNVNVLWNKGTEVVSIISKYLDDKNAPPFYGPNMPNSTQIHTINNESHKRIIINQQEKLLESFKSIIDTIKEEMKTSDILEQGEGQESKGQKVKIRNLNVVDPLIMDTLTPDIFS